MGTYFLSVLPHTCIFPYVWYYLSEIVVVQKQLQGLKLSLGCLGQYLLTRLGASTPARRCRPLEVATLVSVHVGGEMCYPSGRGRLILLLFV